ncbi:MULTISPECIES: hypothetical protein [unclassified Nitrobacter]|uniref:hypothetical protein n=1 Tax=unclassified Nitrobacter TaxID=2620411 RepID=UPI0009293372|nr:MULTISPECIES: hypothetical protein [unclassified Nitrobacter]MBN9148042.1 hypothetical protein [Nitrobacter sp.]OJV03896.1 MAG: hypothetical protein BGO16_05740 [Nitrobacter sp. 62-23]
MNWPRSRNLASRNAIARTTARGQIVGQAAPKMHSVAGARPDAIPENYQRYYVEMIEDIAAWLKGAQASGPRPR